MHTRGLFFIIILIFSYGCFNQEDATKKKANELLHQITTLEKDLDSKIKTYKNSTNPLEDTSKELYQDWKKKYANYKKQEIYMNYDRQVMALEQLQEDLKNIQDLVSNLK